MKTKKNAVVGTRQLKQIAIIFYFLLATGFQGAGAEDLDTISFSWTWSSGDSGYSAGPGGDIAYNLYMRTEDEADYDYDYPMLEGIDNCWWENEKYSCQAALDHDFEPGVTYFFTVAAYVVEDFQSEDTQDSESSEVRYKKAVDGGAVGDVNDTIGSGDDENGSDASENTDDSSTSEESSGSGGGSCFISSTAMMPSFLNKIKCFFDFLC